MRRGAVLHHDSTRFVTRKALGIFGEITPRLARGFRSLTRSLQCAHALDTCLARKGRAWKSIQQGAEMLGFAAIVAVVTSIDGVLEQRIFLCQRSGT